MIDPVLRDVLRQILIDLAHIRRRLESPPIGSSSPRVFIVWTSTAEETADTFLRAAEERPALEEVARTLGWTWEIPI